MIDLPDFWRLYINKKEQEKLEERKRKSSAIIGITSPPATPPMSPSSSPPRSWSLSASFSPESSFEASFKGGNAEKKAASPVASLTAVTARPKLRSIPSKAHILTAGEEGTDPSAAAAEEWSGSGGLGGESAGELLHSRAEVKDLKEQNLNLKIELQRQKIEKETKERTLKLTERKLQDTTQEVGICKQRLAVLLASSSPPPQDQGTRTDSSDDQLESNKGEDGVKKVNKAGHSMPLVDKEIQKYQMALLQTSEASFSIEQLLSEASYLVAELKSSTEKTRSQIQAIVG